MSDNVLPITPGLAVETSVEREFVDDLAMKVRKFVEKNGCLPEVAVLALYGGDTGLAWSVGFNSPVRNRAPVEVYGTALGLVTRKLAQSG